MVKGHHHWLMGPISPLLESEHGGVELRIWNKSTLGVKKKYSSSKIKFVLHKFQWLIINYWPLQSLEKQNLFNSALSVNDLIPCCFCSNSAAVADDSAWGMIFLLRCHRYSAKHYLDADKNDADYWEWARRWNAHRTLEISLPYLPHIKEEFFLVGI